MKKFIYTLALVFSLAISFNSAQAADKKAKKPNGINC